MAKLHILDKTGDTEFDLETEFDLATEFFQQKLAEGGMAYEVSDNPERDKRIIWALTPETQKVIIVGAQAGG